MKAKVVIAMKLFHQRLLLSSWCLAFQRPLARRPTMHSLLTGDIWTRQRTPSWLLLLPLQLVLRRIQSFQLRSHCIPDLTTDTLKLARKLVTLHQQHNSSCHLRNNGGMDLRKRPLPQWLLQRLPQRSRLLNRLRSRHLLNTWSVKTSESTSEQLQAYKQTMQDTLRKSYIKIYLPS